MSRPLHHALTQAAARFPDRIAIVEPGHGSICYRDFAELSDRVRDRLLAMGIGPGHRVGLYLRKSIDAITAMYGILKGGAAYVPVDPGAPAARGAYIMHDCAVTAVITEARLAEKFAAELRLLEASPTLLKLNQVGAGKGIAACLEQLAATGATTPVASAQPRDDELAYILYTSGSTGKPKGVMLSHENAVSFVDWCSQVFEPNADDRFSSHAPLHFDLSILDIHVCLKHGAALVLIGEEVGKDPLRLAKLISEERISIWYSAPSILSLLAQFGNLASRDCRTLRQELFAGEVFPVKHLRALAELWPHPRYFNLYGPTETNVCTYYEVRLPIPAERSVPYPIGAVCSHLRGRNVDESGAGVAAGAEGELCISGSGVMQGYWALPEQTRTAFFVDANGTHWYRTGDIVVEDTPGSFIYRGRRDRMVKRRGYRVELGEIEAGVYKHPQVKEAAVVAVADEEAGVRITAFLSCKQAPAPSLIEMKRFCSEHLPLYMIPDRFTWLEALPKTSTDKIDYQRLKEMC